MNLVGGYRLDVLDRSGLDDGEQPLGVPGRAGQEFDGIPFPGVVCSCAPPDTNGEVGLTQYTQIVNEGFQVFDKVTGASVFGPVAISSVWAFGFTYGMLWLIDRVTPVKVVQAAEESGLDAALHGETAYLGTS